MLSPALRARFQLHLCADESWMVFDTARGGQCQPVPTAAAAIEHCMALAAAELTDEGRIRR